MAGFTLHFKGSKQKPPEHFEASRPMALGCEYKNICVFSQCYLSNLSISPWSTSSKASCRNATSLMTARFVLPISTF